MPFVTIPAHTINIFFTEAYYFDNDANGFIDSITLIFSGPIENSDLSTLRQNIVLPSWRNFSVQSLLIPQAGIVAIKVVENRSIPVTSVNTSDYLVFDSVILPGGGSVIGKSLRIRDNVAPVLLSATLHTYSNNIDSLEVRFSEPVVSFNHRNPFKYSAPDGNPYDVSLVNGTLRDSVYYSIPQDASEMSDGDSVWINIAASITDLANNTQENGLNRRVLLNKKNFHGELVLQDAAYFDENGDGFIDHITMTVVGALLQSDVQEILKMITLPSFRNFTVISSVVNDNLLSITVNELNNEPNTGVSFDDKIVITGGIVPGRFLVKNGIIYAKDSVAPVIIWAHLDAHDVGNDTISIKLSEPVVAVTNGEPFLFLRPGTGNFTVILTNVSLDNDGKYIGHVISVETDSLGAGDSVWINTDADISDRITNSQLNPHNRRVQLTIDWTDFPVTLSNPVYFDNNADGFIDRIKFKYAGPVYDSDLEILKTLIRFPASRNFTIQDIRRDVSTITLTIIEYGSTPRTNVLPNEKITIVSQRLPDDAITTSQTLDIIDSVAPVVISAHFDWFGNTADRVRIVLSEPVNTIFSQQPFIFKKPNGESFIVSLQSDTRSETDTYYGLVLSAANPRGLEQNDSVWINATSNVNDLLRNVQLSEANRKVLLTVDVNFEFRVVAENNPYSEGNRPMPHVVQQAYSEKKVPLPTDGLVLVVEPDRKLTTEFPVQGSVSIYDAVQNVVIQKKIMVYQKSTNRLYFVWNGRNYNGRKVGAGTYLAIVKINGHGKNITQKINLGVKR
jgi:hypothetical protein